MNISLSTRKKLAVAVGILSVSSAAIFIRLCQQEVEEVTIAFSIFIASSRLLITTIILMPTYLNLRKIKGERISLFYSVGAGICLTFHFACWITSLNFTSVAASVSLVTTNPLWVALLSWWFFKQPITQRTIVGIFIAISGSLVIAFAGGNTDFGTNPLLGATLALSGAWFVSGYMLFGKVAQEKGLTTSQYITIAYLTAGVFLFPLPFIFGDGYLGYPFPVYIYLILMAIVSQIIGHTCLNWSLRHFSPTTVSLLILLEPIISTLLAWWLFMEVPPLLVIVGGGILLMGVLISLKKF